MERENNINSPSTESLDGHNYASLQEQLNAQQQALAQIYKSVEKTRKYIFWTGVFNAIVFIAPMIAIALLLPQIMNTFTSSLGALEGISQASTNLESVVAEPGLRESLEALQGLGLGF